MSPFPSADSRRILIVEDDMTSASALRALLTRRGFEVVCAATVGDGLAELRSAMPGWIILDLMLPDGDGVQILQHVRAAGLRARVAITTGVNDPDRLGKVRAFSPELVLSKPIDLAALLRFLDPSV